MPPLTWRKEVRTKTYDPLHQLLMLVLVQVLDTDQLPLRIVQAFSQLRDSVRESLEMSLSVVEENPGGRPCFIERRDGRCVFAESRASRGG